VTDKVEIPPVEMGCGPTKIGAGKEEKGAVTKTGPPTVPAYGQASKTTATTAGSVGGASSSLCSKASGTTSGKVTSINDRGHDDEHLLATSAPPPNVYCGRRLAPADLKQAQEEVANDVIRWKGQLVLKKKIESSNAKLWPRRFDAI